MSGIKNYVTFNNKSLLSELDSCDKSPCRHGGTCTDTGDSFTCACVDAYTGIVCELGNIRN